MLYRREKRRGRIVRLRIEELVDSADKTRKVVRHRRSIISTWGPRLHGPFGLFCGR